MKTLGKSYLKGSDLVTRDIAGETIIVPIRDGVDDLNSIYTLNELGTRIWELIDGKTDVKKMAETIAEEYEVSEEQATNDIKGYLDALEAKGLIHLSTDEPMILGHG